MNELMIDVGRSTVTIAGHRFPAALAICPQHEEGPTRSDWSHSLGQLRRSGIVGPDIYIPAENGLLLEVAEQDPDRPGLSLTLSCCACEETGPQDDRAWLPMQVALIDGEIVGGAGVWRRGHWHWSSAEPEWVVETIERLSRRPFALPAGPEVRLVPLAHPFVPDAR